ncbi:MAG: TraR/DksA family transcriptional regulator [Minisyncoccota bacterium]
MILSQKFLEGRKRHLVAKLTKTEKATQRVVILPEAKLYKETVLIPQIIAAMKRIDDGTYGYCSDCGELIPEARLLRHPHVKRCVPCQNDAESKQAQYRTP